MNQIIYILTLSAMLTGCGSDNPFNDMTPIDDTDQATIMIEMQRCAHVSEEGSWTAAMRSSPSMDCLNHLKRRIVHNHD